MKTTVAFRKTGLFAALMAGSLAIMGGTAHAQLTRPLPTGDSDPNRLGNALKRELVQAMLEKALPKFDATVLRVGDGKPFTENLSFQSIFEAMNDKPIVRTDLPKEALQVSDTDRVGRLDPSKGKVRYINRLRSWSLDKFAKTSAFDEKKTSVLVLDTLRKLSFPSEELGNGQIDTQMAGGAEAGAEQVKDQYEMYRVVKFDRLMNQLPVFDSKVAAAVSNDGQIQRFQAVWPTFHLRQNLKMLDRAAVVQNTVDAIMAQQPMRDTHIQAFIAYAPFGHGERQVTYVPSVIVNVNSLPTPYQMVVPVAEAPKGDESTRVVTGLQ